MGCLNSGGADGAGQSLNPEAAEATATGRLLLPPRLSLSAGFTWIGRAICGKGKHSQGGRGPSGAQAPDAPLCLGTHPSNQAQCWGALSSKLLASFQNPIIIIPPTRTVFGNDSVSPSPL